MIIIFLFTFSINYVTGFKWFCAKQDFEASAFSKHIIETRHKNFSLEFRGEYLYITYGYPESPPYFGKGPECLFTTGIFKSSNFKGIQFEPCLSLGTLSYGLRELTSFIFSPSFKIKKRIPNTNLIIGLNPSLYLPIAFFKKHLFTERYFTLWFDIGCIIKD